MVASLIDYVPCRHGRGWAGLSIPPPRRHCACTRHPEEAGGHHLQQVPVRHCWGGRLKTSGVTC